MNFIQVTKRKIKGILYRTGIGYDEDKDKLIIDFSNTGNGAVKQKIKMEAMKEQIVAERELELIEIEKSKLKEQSKSALKNEKEARNQILAQLAKSYSMRNGLSLDQGIKIVKKIFNLAMDQELTFSEAEKLYSQNSNSRSNKMKRKISRSNKMKRKIKIVRNLKNK